MLTYLRKLHIEAEESVNQSRNGCLKIQNVLHKRFLLDHDYVGDFLAVRIVHTENVWLGAFIPLVTLQANQLGSLFVDDITR